MSRLTLIFSLLFCSTSIFAQFKISGKIDNYTGHEDLKINIPIVYGYFDANSVSIPVAKNGTFSITLPIKEQKFANVMFRQTVHLLLLTPGKDLAITLNETDRDFKLIKGTSLPENNLLQTLNIDEYPFFLQNSDPYISLSVSDMKAKIVKPYFTARDKKLALINQSAITSKNKKLIAEEVKSADYNNLYEMLDVSGQYQKTIDKLIIDVFDNANANPAVLPAGPNYYKFANNYLAYLETKAVLNAKKPNSVPTNIIVRLTGATKHLPPAVAEQIIYQHIIQTTHNNNKETTAQLVKIFNEQFPKSAYNADIRKRINTLN